MLYEQVIQPNDISRHAVVGGAFWGKNKVIFLKNIRDNILPSNGPKQRLRPLGVVTTRIYEQDLICRRKGSSMNSKAELKSSLRIRYKDFSYYLQNNVKSNHFKSYQIISNQIITFEI